jgi:hypothetical protein
MKSDRILAHPAILSSIPRYTIHLVIFLNGLQGSQSLIFFRRRLAGKFQSAAVAKLDLAE